MTGEQLIYARGLAVDTYRGERRVGHGGAWAGYRAYFMRLPDRGMSIAVLCNDASANTAKLGERMADVLIGSKNPETTKDGAKLTRTPPPNVSGVFVDRVTGGAHRLTVENGRLLVGNPPKSVALDPLPNDRWGIDKFSFAFLTDGNGYDFVDSNGHPRRFLRVAEPFTNFSEYAGAYHSDELGATYRFRVHDGALWFVPERGSESKLSPRFRDGFQFPSAMLAFTRDAKGQINGMTLSNRGVWLLPFTRI